MHTTFGLTLPQDGGYGRIRMFASVGWGLTAPLAGWVVAAYGLQAAFLCFALLVGLCLLPACLLPMEVLAASPGPQGGAAAAQGSAGVQGSPDSGGLSAPSGRPSDKLAVQGEGSSGGVLEVRIGGDGLAEAGKAAPLVAPNASWSIGAGLAPAADRSPISQPEASRAIPASPASPPVFHLVADCRAGRPPPPAVHTPLLGSPSPSPSPGPPLLSPAHRPLLPASNAPVAPLGGWHSSSSARPLEVVLDSDSLKQKLALPTAGVSPPQAGGVWEGLLGLLRDVHVLVFFFLVGWWPRGGQALSWPPPLGGSAPSAPPHCVPLPLPSDRSANLCARSLLSRHTHPPKHQTPAPNNKAYNPPAMHCLIAPPPTPPTLHPQALLMGVGNGAIGYLFLYLDELEAPATLMGLCLSVRCCSAHPRPCPARSRAALQSCRAASLVRSRPVHSPR
jgi:hypothetical protein